MVVRTTGTLLLASLCLFLFSGLSLFSECTGAGELSGVRYGRHVQKRNADGVLTMPCRVYRIHTELKTFYEAKSICQANNGQDAQMAKIPSSTVNEALFALFASSMSENAYFGARDKLTEEIWLYEDGSEVCFQDWAFFRPVTDPTANCATFTLNVGGHWLDDSCLTPRPFICQFTETDDCAPEPCLNGGTCTDEIIGYTCACPSGFTGQNCETGGASCLTEGCQNGGECTESGICQCDSHFIGDACETCVPNSADVSGSFSAISAVYPSTMTLDTNTAFTSFSVGSDTYLVTYQKSGMGDGVAVHQFVPGSPVSYTFIQNLAESEVKHVEAFKILGRQYLAIAQYDTTDVNLHSSIYRMVDGSTTFSKIQTIQSPLLRESNFHFFVSSHGHFLVLSGGDGNSVLYDWEEQTDSFAQFQYFSGVLAQQLASFTENSDTYLVFATTSGNPKVFVQTSGASQFTEVANSNVEDINVNAITTFLFNCENYLVTNWPTFSPPTVYEWDSISQSFNAATFVAGTSSIFFAGDVIKSFEIDSYPFAMMSAFDPSANERALMLIKPQFNSPNDLEIHHRVPNTSGEQPQGFHVFDSDGKTYLVFVTDTSAFTLEWQATI